MTTKPKKRECSRCKKKNAVPPARLCATCKRLSKKASQEKARDNRAVNVYGLLPGEYQLLLDSSPHGPGTCYICGGKSGKSLAVDHDHKKTGRESVRGLLCAVCNTWLLARVGRDNVDRLQMLLTNAVAYMKQPPAQEILGGTDERR